MTVDGRLDDWPDDMAVFTPRENANVYGATDLSGTDLDTSTDFSPSFRVEEQRIYVAMVHRDDRLYVASRIVSRSDAGEINLAGLLHVPPYCYSLVPPGAGGGYFEAGKEGNFPAGRLYLERGAYCDLFSVSTTWSVCTSPKTPRASTPAMRTAQRYWAALQSSLACAKVLLDSGAQVDPVYPSLGWTPFLWHLTAELSRRNERAPPCYPGLHNTGGRPSVESLNLFAPSQVRYLVGKRASCLGLPCSLGKMTKDRAAE